jgi:pyrimidine operon attenuation protein/uracil phosphoribosyltransferase
VVNEPLMTGRNVRQALNTFGKCGKMLTLTL